MTKTCSLWLAVTVAAGLAATPAVAQIGGPTGPLTGIPSGLGANGSMSFTAAPSQPAIGVSSGLPGAGLPTASGGVHRVRRRH